MKNTTIDKSNHTVSKKIARGSRSMRMETLEIRNLLAANTLDFVDNLSIAAPGQTRDLQLVVGDSSSKSVVGLRIAGTSGNLDPAVPLIFVRDADRSDSANHIPLMYSYANVGGTQDSLVFFEVEGGEEFTIQVGGTSGAGDFRAEVFLFGSTNDDGVVTENEYMRAVAAELQARGAGNHNTAAYFQSVYGINFNQSQYNVGFDANMNGKVDGFEVGMVNANLGNGPIDIDLIGDNEAPAIEASVAVDTGRSDSDNITSVTADDDGNAIVGTITDFSTIVSAYVTVDGVEANKINLVDPATSINELEVTDTSIQFGLDLDDLEALLGSSVLNTGKHTLTIVATDELGNVNETAFELDFVFDTEAPVQPDEVTLEPASDTGSSDSDNITSDTTPTLVVNAEAGSTVEIFADGESLGTATETSAGVFTFTPETGLGEGVYTLTAVATDAAGNVSTASDPVEMTIDTIAPDVPTDIVLDNKTANDNLTDETTGEFSGRTEANAEVRVLSGDTVLGTTIADANGDFSFTGIALELGLNELTFEARDAAGNAADIEFTVWRNTAPTIVDNQLFSVDENEADGVVVGQVDADGNDTGDTLTYAITDIDDGFEGAFAIDAETGIITVADPSLLDFENQNTFTLTIQVTDSYGDGLGGAGLTTTETITISLNDVNEAPVIEGQTIDGVLENTTDPPITNNGVGTVIGTIPVSDPDAGDTHTFTIVSGNESGAFTINDNGQIVVADASQLDFEVNPTFTLDVQVTDNGGPGDDALSSEVVQIVINLANVNERPSIADQVLDPIDENANGVDPSYDSGDIVGTVDFTDPDADDTFTFEIVGGNTDGAFTIDNEGNVRVANASALDFETNPQFDLQVRVTDAGGLTSDTVTVTINLNDLNDAPEVDQEALDNITLEVDENSPAGTQLTLDGSTAINLDDYFSDVDAGQTLTYTIVGGDPNGAFSVDGNAIVVADGSKLDFETNPTYTLTIQATDDAGNPLAVTGTVEVSLNDLNELPEIPGGEINLGTISLLDVDEAGEIGNILKSIGLVDPEGDNLTYTLVPGGSGDEFFTLDADGNIILTNVITAADLEGGNSGDQAEEFELQFMLADDGTLPPGALNAGPFTVRFTVSDNDPPVFDSPEETQFSISENIDGSVSEGDNLSPTLVLEATDPEGDDFSFSVEASSTNSSAALADLFRVEEVEGQFRVTVADPENLTYNYVNANGATDGVFNLDLVVTDTNGRSSRLTIEVTVVDENNAPTFTDPGVITIDEYVAVGPDGTPGTTAGTVVLDLSTVFSDADLNQTLTYTIESAQVDGTGADISAAFTIENGQVVVADPTLLDAETLSSITLTITADDQQGEANSTITEQIVVELNEQNELPIYSDPTDPFGIQYKYVDADDLADNKSVLGNILDILSEVDPEGDTITFTQRTEGASGEAYFSLDANGNIVLDTPLSFDEQSKDFELVCDYADSQGLSSTDLGFTDGFTLIIRVSKNQAPEITSANAFDVDENTADGTDVFTVTSTDAEGEDVTYSLDDPSGTFVIDPQTGVISIADNATLDYETNTSLTVTVTATDATGNPTTQEITVNIVDVNEAPSVIGAVNFEVSEDASNGDVVGTVSVSDPDAGDTFTYEITGGTGQGIFAVNANGEIVVANADALDFEGTNSYTLEITVTDNGGPTPGSNQLSDVGQFTIDVSDVNEAPELTGSAITLPMVIENDLTSEEIGVEDEVFRKVYTNAQYNFLGQFTDPEGDVLELSVANLAELTAVDYIQNVFYDNDLQALIVDFFHYAGDQDRSPVTVQLEATEAETVDGLVSTQTLGVGISVDNQQAVDFRFIPVASPTEANSALAGTSEENLPTAIDRVADEQTFVVELWSTVLIGGPDHVAPGRAWVEGLQFILLQMNFNNELMSVTNAVVDNRIAFEGTQPIVNNATGQIEEFGVFFGLDNVPEGVSDGYNDATGMAEFVRLGYIEFTVNEGQSSNGISLDDLISLDFNGDNSSILLNGADDEDVDPGADPNNEPNPIWGTGAIQSALDPSQVAITTYGVEVVDAVKFQISQDDSLAAILVGSTGSKIAGNEVAGQGGNGNGNLTNLTGSIYVLFNGDETNPDSFEIIGSELILTNSGNYAPGAPTTAGGNPVIGGTSAGNFGLTSTNVEGPVTTNSNVAIRETVIRIAGSPSVSLSSNPYNGSVNFSSDNFEYQIGSGYADVSTRVLLNGNQISQNSDREGLAGRDLANRGSETSSLQGNGTGAYTLSLDLSRYFLDGAFDISGTDINVEMLINATIVATVNGGVPLQGTVFAKDGQPLEDGSGVFVSVVKNPTKLDAGGQVAQLPTSAQWVSEWDSVWVEVWGSTADAAGILGGTVDLGYDTTLYTATQIEYAGSMTEARTGTIDDANGKIIGLGSQSLQSDLGNGSFVLLGRVKLESLPGDGIDVSVDQEYKAHSLGLSVDNATLNLAEIGTTTADVGQTPDVEVWGVAFDVNNDGRIGLADFSKFVQYFGSSSLTSNEALVAALDFDNNGSVGLSDFSYFVQNFGKTKLDAATIKYPETFTQTWVGRKIELSGPDSLTDVFDKALADWQAALGLDRPVDVKLVVKDYGDAQLGEAQLLTLDENGLPAFGVLTLDDDGAGLGWSADLAGGPADGQYDLYTVILHELGHLYGFVNHYSGFADNVITDYDGNKLFIGPDFIAHLDPHGHHLDETAHADDVMNGLLEPGIRKTISSLDVQILQAAYNSVSAGASVQSGVAALHALAGENRLADAPFQAQPLKFVFDDVVDVQSISGQTGFATPVAQRVADQLVRNGVRVTSHSLPQFQRQMDEVDSAVATFQYDDDAVLASNFSAEAEYLATDEASTNLDDLFAQWELDADLEG